MGKTNVCHRNAQGSKLWRPQCTIFRHVHEEHALEARGDGAIAVDSVTTTCNSPAHLPLMWGAESTPSFGCRKVGYLDFEAMFSPRLHQLR